MIVLFQILTRTLQSQNEDGSWGKKGNREETAYALITLANVDSLPFVTPIAGQIETAISKGRKYLNATGALENLKLTPNDYVWSGKIAYGVEHVCQILLQITHVFQHGDLEIESVVNGRISFPP